MIYARKEKLIEMPVYDSNQQKPFEYVNSITDVNSSSYKLLHGEGVKYEQDGTISVDNYVAVAMGQSYGSIGDRFRIKLSSDHWMNVVIADSKCNCDTTGGFGWTGKNGHTIEMIVWDTPKSARGTYCYGGLELYKGTITRILKEEQHEQ